MATSTVTSDSGLSLTREVERLALALSRAETEVQHSRSLHNEQCTRLARGEPCDLESARVRLDQATARVIGIQRELCTKREQLDKIESAEQAVRVREQVVQAFNTADEGLRLAKSELDRLIEIQRSLPDQLFAARLQFNACLLAYNEAVLRKESYGKTNSTA
jgi:hypothetical protein